jgi:hypothetical protein
VNCSKGYETEVSGLRVAVQRARDFRNVTELADKGSQVGQGRRDNHFAFRQRIYSH